MKITVETTVNAPISTVWSAYTTPDDIKKWNSASDDWHTTSASVDLRVGGNADYVRFTCSQSVGLRRTDRTCSSRAPGLVLQSLHYHV